MNIGKFLDGVIAGVREEPLATISVCVFVFAASMAVMVLDLVMTCPQCGRFSTNLRSVKASYGPSGPGGVVFAQTHRAFVVCDKCSPPGSIAATVPGEIAQGARRHIPAILGFLVAMFAFVIGAFSYTLYFRLQSKRKQTMIGYSWVLVLFAIAALLFWSFRKHY